MKNREAAREAFLDDLAPIVDGDPDALARHADFLVDDDDARDARFEASEASADLADAGSDYVHPTDFESRFLAALDGVSETDAAEPAPSEDDAASRTDAASWGEAPAAFVAGAPEGDRAHDEVSEADDPGRTTSPGFASPVDASVDEASGEALGETSSEPSVAGGTLRMVATSSSDDGSSKAETATTSPTKNTDKTKKSGGRAMLFLVPLLGAGALAAAAALFFAIGGADDDTPPEPTLATRGIEGQLGTIDRAASDGESGVTIQRRGGEAFVALTEGAQVPAGSTVRTDARTRAQLVLADGTELVLNHGTELELDADTPRGFRLRDGELVADVAHLEGAPNARFETPTGEVEVLGTKFVLSANSDVTSVMVSRGVVSVSGQDGTQANVRAGEEGLVRRAAAPEVTAVTNLAQTMAWSELGAPEEEEPDTIPGIGSLRARRPGEQQAQERPLALARHDVRVRIVGNVARTEIEEVFRNDSDQTLEGVYRFPLPADAQIARLALDVEGRMEEGAFVERDRAARIWRGVIRNATPQRQRQQREEFIWVPGPWRDPAILEWQRGGQFELRIFPIPAHGERRVVIAYTQQVAPQGARRRYVYPLAHSADDSTRVGQFNLDVRVAHAERVSASGYRVTSAAEEDATRLRLSENAFSPKGDLIIDYELPGGERPLRSWTYRGNAALPPPEASRDRDREVLDAQRRLAGDDRPYVVMALRPDLPRDTERSDRDFVFVVDASQSMVGERFDRASRLTSRIVSELDRRDRFTVLACDYQCRAMPGGLQPPSARAAGQVAAWLNDIEPAGASDLVAVMREAAATVSADRRDTRALHLAYIGDGVSTTGYRRAASLSAEVSALAEAEHLTVNTVGIGGDADTVGLEALARASGGHYVPYVPGQRTAVAATAVLESHYGASLQSPEVVLPAGLSDSAPAAIATVRAGQEILVAARMDRSEVNGEVVLRGTVAGRPFEERHRVELVATEAAGNRFVPRVWASKRIEQLQLAGRGQDRADIIALSKAYGVMSRHTSLLVLESEAMFRAFRVDRRQATDQWTGEEDLVGGEAEAAEEGLAEAQVPARLGRSRVGSRARGIRRASRRPRPSLDGALGSGGFGNGAGRAPAPAPAAQQARAQAPLDDADREASDRSGSLVNGWEGWGDMPSPGTEQPRAAMPTPRPRPRRRGPGQWMERRRIRVGEISSSRGPTAQEERQADQAVAALEANEDSRDRHREAYRRLVRANRLGRALEVAEAWIGRDRLDPDALTAKADVLARMGHRGEALRLLTGTVDLAPESESLHRRLADAFDRFGRHERACSHRIAIAEIDEADGNAVGAAMRCERELGRTEASARILNSVREASVRRTAERVAGQEARSRGFSGDFTIDASWDGGQDLDLTIVTPQGTRLSWMGGRTTVVGDRASSTEGERLGLRWTAPGTYLVEVHRTDPNDTGVVRGRLQIRALGQRQTVAFTLSGEQETVARVRVRRESQLVPVTGTVGPRFR
ncbi:MAG: VIT domain-containing protein [Sandaracinaceae bacterium]